MLLVFSSFFNHYPCRHRPFRHPGGGGGGGGLLLLLSDIGFVRTMQVGRSSEPPEPIEVLHQPLGSLRAPALSGHPDRSSSMKGGPSWAGGDEVSRRVE